ncbi:MAG: SseB family protein, partial [Ornithinimicrobium sp.]
MPWQGRTLAGTGFDADDGLADRRLLTALGITSDVTGSSETAVPAARVTSEPSDDIELVRAVSQARLIIPIVAVPGEDASSDMAAVTLSAPDGRKALPAFTSAEQLARWDARSRPVPVSAQRAALAGVQE